VKTTPHSVGYIELAYAMQNDVQFAQIRNHDGNYIEANLESVSAAAAGAVLPDGDGDWSGVHILDAPGANSYPISSFTYILIYKELYIDQTQMNRTAAEALLDWLWWIVHPDGQSYADDMFYAPLPSAVVTINEATLESITYKGETIL
jgi:ABC-type phosphate transport system substrate-binding protein